jgi:cyanate permease
MNTGNQIGAALTASLTPWIAARYGWTASFLVAAALCFLGAACWLIVDPAKSLVLGNVPPLESGSSTVAVRRQAVER